jgi:hypothetical protein
MRCSHFKMRASSRQTTRCRKQSQVTLAEGLSKQHRYSRGQPSGIAHIFTESPNRHHERSKDTFLPFETYLVRSGLGPPKLSDKSDTQLRYLPWAFSLRYKRHGAKPMQNMMLPDYAFKRLSIQSGIQLDTFDTTATVSSARQLHFALSLNPPASVATSFKSDPHPAPSLQ